jgi:hypothetical protein
MSGRQGRLQAKVAIVTGAEMVVDDGMSAL